MFQDWPSRGVLMYAPPTDQVDRFCQFVRDVFVKDGIDTMVLLVRYRYQFESHPGCRGVDPISKADAKKIADTCRECGIHLIPKMNMLGHQSNGGSVATEGILLEHPEYDENKGKSTDYCSTICASEPGAMQIMLEMADEMIDAFGADAFHIGCDEAFELGKCDKCKDTPTAVLYANWVNGIVDHLQARGIEVWMWGDRFLNAAENDYGKWEASFNGTEGALQQLRKGVVICDWHYEDRLRYDSPAIFAKAGFKVYLCTYSDRNNAKMFLDYAADHDQGNILGRMETTWYPASAFMNCYEGKPVTESIHEPEKLAEVVDCYRYMFEEN